MPTGHTMEDLFVPEPVAWGLRGDPFLWRALRVRGREVPLPGSREEVSRQLHHLIGEVLEQRWDDVRVEESFYHPSLAHGGMSSGHVHVATWRGRLIPLVLARAEALHEYYRSAEF